MSDRNRSRHIRNQRARRKLKSGDYPVLPAGTVVMARMRGHQEWPGMVVDTDTLPDSVLVNHPGANKIAFPVRYFPRGEHGWIFPPDLRVLPRTEIRAFLKGVKDGTRRPVKLLLQAYEAADDPKEWLRRIEVLLSYLPTDEEGGGIAQSPTTAQQSAKNKGRGNAESASAPVASSSKRSATPRPTLSARPKPVIRPTAKRGMTSTPVPSLKPTLKPPRRPSQAASGSRPKKPRKPPAEVLIESNANAEVPTVSAKDDEPAGDVDPDNANDAETKEGLTATTSLPPDVPFPTTKTATYLSLAQLTQAVLAFDQLAAELVVLKEQHRAACSAHDLGQLRREALEASVVAATEVRTQREAKEKVVRGRAEGREAELEEKDQRIRAAQERIEVGKKRRAQLEVENQEMRTAFEGLQNAGSKRQKVE
ncbi:unnamed protein product [Mycena citricolor]|uniref:PWWP domain-containing protein n=1 Tax=Mycena citricolor TaxID=2018698 RepID=A0AAD2GYB9_9AGAR|nr:unnamed protein product [Mycena citricolor]